MRIFLAILACTACINNYAQQKENQLRFNSVNTFGYMIGSKTKSESVSTINGVRWQNWSAGIGAGIDWYDIRSVPVFLDVRKYFTDKKNQPFVYADGGLSVAWPNKQIKNWYSGYDFRNTFYGECGIGYNWKISDGLSALLSAGYSYKRSLLKVKNTPTQNYFTTYDYYYFPISQYDFEYRRIAIRIGLQF